MKLTDKTFPYQEFGIIFASFHLTQHSTIYVFLLYQVSTFSSIHYFLLVSFRSAVIYYWIYKFCLVPQNEYTITGGEVKISTRLLSSPCSELFSSQRHCIVTLILSVVYCLLFSVTRILNKNSLSWIVFCCLQIVTLLKDSRNLPVLFQYTSLGRLRTGDRRIQTPLFVIPLQSFKTFPWWSCFYQI